jgi:UDP-2-acetamido-3-amino-2,3-dideoxy-glucuronate N-acetyltransferase
MSESRLPEYFVHPTAVVDEGCVIGAGSKIWHFSHLMSGCMLGERCNIGQNVVVSPEVVLGTNVKVQNNVSLYTGLKCEDDVFIGPSAVFTNVKNPRSAFNRRDQYQPTILRRGVTIGANSTIVCGIEIGAFAFVAAGAVVIRDVKPYSLVAGNPAKHKGWMSEAGHRLILDLNGQAKCPETGDLYQLLNETIQKINHTKP